MKKIIYIICILFVGTTFLSSCNKKLKDDLDSLEKELADLKERENQTREILGSNEPIQASTQFVDDNGDTRTIKSTLSFKANDYSTQYMEEDADGNYWIYIERFGDVDGYDNSDAESAYIGFLYNTTTNEITNKDIYHEWLSNGPYDDNISYYENWEPAPTINLTLNNINVSTGNISLTVTASGDGDYTNYWGGPNNGESVSTTLSFTGKLKVFAYDPSSTPARLSAKK
jgi:hypothetical protein